jgi:hypothetical protein
MAVIGIGPVAGLLCAILFGIQSKPAGDALAAPREITVTANDYAFMPLPPIEAGPTIFSFVNQGKVNHELAIGRLKATASVDDYVKATPGAQRIALLDGFVGILIAGPGLHSDGRVLVDLTKGVGYVVWCNFRDKPDAPQHMTLGMYTGFTPR